MMYSAFQQVEEEIPFEIYVTVTIFAVLISGIVFWGVIKLIEAIYVYLFGKSLFNFAPLFKKRLTKQQREFLKTKLVFYKNLTPKQQRIFEDRVVRFINDKQFIGREGFNVTDASKLIISGTAILLTFGFKHYMIYSIEKIIIYPKVFFSTSNNELHKGEFNPHLKAIVFSWEDFLQGFKISNDNLNLGIHEFTHAFHIDNMRSSSETAIIFENGFRELTRYLEHNPELRQRLLASTYIRNYAYTNQFEFLAVIIETFFETPQQFKTTFPKLYQKVKQMLNFNFEGY